MRKFNSLLSFSSFYNDDVWGRIFRFNKCVKAFKYIAYSSSPKLKRRYQFKFHVNFNYYFKRTKSPVSVRNPTNLFGSRLRARKKVQYFYGKLSKRQFRVLFFNTKGKSSYSRVNYLYQKFEFRIDILLFRSGWFIETIKPMQSVYHGFTSIDGFKVSNPFREVSVGQFVTLSNVMFNVRDIIRRINHESFVFPSPYIFVSEFIPVFILFRPFRLEDIKIYPNVDRFSILRYYYLLPPLPKAYVYNVYIYTCYNIHYII